MSKSLTYPLTILYKCLPAKPAKPVVNPATNVTIKRTKPVAGTLPNKGLAPENMPATLSTRFSFPENISINENPTQRVTPADEETAKACPEDFALNAQAIHATRGSIHQGPTTEPIAPNTSIIIYNITS